MVYGTEYEYGGKTYTIVWGYESQNNPNTTAAAGVLDAFGPDSNVKVTGDTIDGTDSAQYTVTIYGALREVTDPVIPTNPEPETPEGSDPTPPAPTTPTTPAVQDARPTTPAVEQAVAKTAPAPETPRESAGTGCPPGERQADPDRYHQLDGRCSGACRRCPAGCRLSAGA